MLAIGSVPAEGLPENNHEPLAADTEGYEHVVGAGTAEGRPSDSEFYHLGNIWAHVLRFLEELALMQ